MKTNSRQVPPNCVIMKILCLMDTLHFVNYFGNNVRQTTSRYIYNTMSNSSMGITNLIGPLEQMTLDDHPISGLYFAVAGVPQVLIFSLKNVH